MAEIKHALLGASSASRWLNCTPSVRLEEQFPNESSVYAAEGSLAHDLAELKLIKGFVEPMTTRKYNSQIKKFKEKELWQDEMLHHTDTYLDYVSEIVHSYNSKPYIAVEKQVNYSSYAPEGFGTADCIIIGDKDIHIIDFKYGQGVPVSSENNPQMKLYALGGYLAYSFLYDIQNVHMTIVQPRLDSISEFSMKIEDLLAWGDSIKEKAQLAYDGKGEYNPGEHCKFCRAKAQCRARAEENIKLAGFEKALPPLISHEEVGKYLEMGKDVAKWVKDLEEFALKECLAGNDVAGWKAVEGRSVREFVDMDKAFEILKAGGVEETLLYERKPLTLSKIEKMIGKKDFNDLVADHIRKAPGKPALVVSSDKRQAISNKTNATEVFA